MRVGVANVVRSEPERTCGGGQLGGRCSGAALGAAVFALVVGAILDEVVPVRELVAYLRNVVDDRAQLSED